MKRLFFALWPSETTRQKMVAVNDRVELVGVRKLKPANLHLTLLYLGTISSKQQASLVAQVDNLCLRAFAFELDGLAYWQGPKILCLTVMQQPSAMLTLVDSLTEIARGYPIFLHDRPFQGHVTLMRKVRSGVDLTYTPIHWQADTFVLVESCSTAQGIQYTVLKEWLLI